MNKKQLFQLYNEKLIDEETFKQKLFELQMQPKVKRKKSLLPKSLTPDEFKNLINIIPNKDKVSRVSFLLAYGAGLRISEIVGSRKNSTNEIKPLSPENFKMDIEPQQIKVYGKYSKERIVPVPKGWKEYMFDVLPINRTDRSIELKFKKYCRLAKLDPTYTFHSLRHSFATRLAGANVPITHIQYLLGHSNVSITNVYTRARPLDALKSYEDLF